MSDVQAVTRSGDQPPPPRSARGRADQSPPARPEEVTGLSPRELRRQRRIATSRDQIMDAAEHLFGTTGYQGTSLEQVARASEFSVGALYSFFASKQELFEAVGSRRGFELLNRMRAAALADGSGAQRLAGLVGAVVGYFHEFPDFARFAMRAYQTGSISMPDEQAASGFQESLDLYADAIEQAQREGTFRAGNPRMLAQLVASLVSAHRTVDPQGDGRSPGVGVDELQEIIANALAAPPAPRRVRRSA